MKVAVLGPGAVGGFLASLLWKNGETITCIARPSRVHELQEKGFRIDSLLAGKFTASVPVSAELEHSVDLLFVTVKAKDLNSSLENLDPRLAEGALIVPLLNGFEHMAVLKAHFPDSRVIAGNIQIEAKYLGPGMIQQTSPFLRMELALNGDESLRKKIQTLFQDSKTEITGHFSEQEVLWRKLIRLCPLACTTAASNLPIGGVRESPEWRKRLEGAVREASAVSARLGFKQDPEIAMGQLDKMPYDLGTSLQRDVNAGKESELDAIAGAIVRQGEELGIACPHISELIKLIEERTKQGERPK